MKIIKRNKLKIILLVLILLLAAALRLWNLKEFPAGINADEASYAYNAYSLISTGKDEHGDSWPVHLKSFADYKPGGTAYLLIPFIKILGLNETATRLPSALAGILSVALIFLLVKELFGDDWLALLTSFSLAISPWHIQFSRGGWETNIATTFLLLGIWLFFKALKNPKLFLLVPLPLIFSMYTYHTPRLVIPLLGIGLLLLYRKRIFKEPKWLIGAALIGLLLLSPLLLDLFGPAVSARFSGVNIFSDTGPFWQINRLRGEHQDPGTPWVRVIHNRPIQYSLEFVQNYLDHFTGSFLFIDGDPIKRSNLQGSGQMYLLEIVFFLAGIYFLLKKRPENWLFPFLWLLVAPIAAALTFQTPNALRAHNLVIPLTIISAYGLYHLICFIKTKIKSRALIFGLCSVLILAISWNFAYFLHQYFIRYPRAHPEVWEYGFAELVPYLEEVKGGYDKIYVTERYDQPYIIFLFHLAYPPKEFQKEVVLTVRDKFGFSTVRDFDQYHFENIVWEELKDQKNVLIVGTDEEIPDGAKIIREVNFKNDQPAFQIAELK